MIIFYSQQKRHTLFHLLARSIVVLSNIFVPETPFLTRLPKLALLSSLWEFGLPIIC